MELRAGTKVRFARGTARTSPWCAREHRAIDWGIPLLLNEEFEVVIMIAVATEEMHGSDRYSDLKLITSEPWLVWQCWWATFSARAKWRSFMSAGGSVEKKYLTGSGVVREAMLRQLSRHFSNVLRAVGTGHFRTEQATVLSLLPVLMCWWT